MYDCTHYYSFYIYTELSDTSNSVEDSPVETGISESLHFSLDYTHVRILNLLVVRAVISFRPREPSPFARLAPPPPCTEPLHCL